MEETSFNAISLGPTGQEAPWTFPALSRSVSEESVVSVEQCVGENCSTRAATLCRVKQYSEFPSRPSDKSNRCHTWRRWNTRESGRDRASLVPLDSTRPQFPDHCPR